MISPALAGVQVRGLEFGFFGWLGFVVSVLMGLGFLITASCMQALVRVSGTSV